MYPYRLVEGDNAPSIVHRPGGTCRITARRGRHRRPGRYPPAGSPVHGPLPGHPIDGDGGPAATVLVAEVNEQGVRVVLDPQPMPRVGLPVQPAHHPAVKAVIGDKGGPPPPVRGGPSRLCLGGRLLVLGVACLRVACLGDDDEVSVEVADPDLAMTGVRV